MTRPTAQSQSRESSACLLRGPPGGCLMGPLYFRACISITSTASIEPTQHD